MKQRGRFAPTPSGLLHIGNVWTALLAWLQIRHAGGDFVLRVEDLDQPRSRPVYREQALVDLRWLGLDWDEGPDVGGLHRPYDQSARLERYDAALQHLRQTGRLYPCYCSRAELLAMASAPHGLSSEGPAYLGTCRSLTAEERDAKAMLKDPSLRFLVDELPLSFDDLVQGEQNFPPGMGGDFVVQRADGIIGYQLAVVVDDAAMGITDVLRGADLLDSTPRQLMLYEALGYAPPTFAHVPLVLGVDGERLAKRNRSTTVVGLREAGVSPEQVIGCLGYLAGLLDRPEPVRAAELVRSFDLRQIPRDPVVLSPDLIARLAVT